MKIFTLLTILCLSVSHNLFGQEEILLDKNTLADYSQYFDEKFGLIVRVSEEFKNLNSFNNELIATKSVGSSPSGFNIGPIFLSKDKQCMYSFDSSLDGSEILEKNLINSPNIKYPISQIACEIETNLGIFDYNTIRKDIKTLKFDFNDYVTTIIGKKPKTMFNCDIIYIYDFPNANSINFSNNSLEKLKGDYPYCTGVFITKSGRVSNGFKLFFTEEGLKKKNEYIEMLSGLIWYKDDFKH